LRLRVATPAPMAATICRVGDRLSAGRRCWSPSRLAPGGPLARAPSTPCGGVRAGMESSYELAMSRDDPGQADPPALLTRAGQGAAPRRTRPGRRHRHDWPGHDSRTPCRRSRRSRCRHRRTPGVKSARRSGNGGAPSWSTTKRSASLPGRASPRAGDPKSLTSTTSARRSSTVWAGPRRRASTPSRSSRKTRTLRPR
jgi:hypothetical protein